MAMDLRSTVLTALALPLCTVSAQAAQLDFKGVAFGSSEETLRAALSEAEFRCYESGSSPSERTCSMSGLTYAGEPTRGTSYATFDASGLQQVLVSLHAQFHANTLAALRAKFGPPSATRSVPKVTKAGLRFTQQVCEWKTSGGGRLAISLYGEPVGEAYVTLSSPANERELARARASKPRAKSDL